MWLGLDIFLLDWTWHGMACYWATVLHKVAWVELAEYPALSSVDSFKNTSWTIKLWNDMTNYWATSFVYMDYCPFFSIVMPRLTFWKNCCPTWHGLVRYWATLFPHVGMVGLGWPHECINANSCLAPGRSVSWHFFIFQIFNFFGMAFG